MSAIQFDLPDARVLDLFAGSGALGIEALSRGAAHVTFVEQVGRTIDVLRANVRSLDAMDECEIVRQDAMKFIASLEPRAFDLALADPPYGNDVAARLAQQWMLVPFATSLWIEHDAKQPMPPAARMRTRRYGDTAITAYTIDE